ncbi:hypothetical protein KUTeg_007223, partial [Tegillarca granosa]
VLVETSWFGLFACDPDAYKTFKEFFDPVIKDYHGVKEINHPRCDFGNFDDIGLRDLDPTGKYVETTRVRIARSVKGYSFNPLITLKERQEIEVKMNIVFDQLPIEIKGEYYPLESLSTSQIQELVDQHYLFNLNNKIYLLFIDLTENWKQTGDTGIGQKQGAFITILIKQEKGNVEFETIQKYGFITASPDNIGTTLRASVHIRIPNMHAKNKNGADYVIDFCNKYNLQARGSRGDPYPPGDTEVYDISNKHRMGLTEIQAVREMQKGIEAIINHEKLKRDA